MMMGRPINNDEEDIVLARFPCGGGNFSIRDAFMFYLGGRL